MSINKVQNQIAFTQRPQRNKQESVAMERFMILPREHYRNVDDIPDTVNNIRPEKGQGRLLSNNVFSWIPRFFANRYYDAKAVIQGYRGVANDHQLGRTNDFGLVAGGVGIASFLATKRIANLPKHMEFIGLASFLTAMSLWPKIGIFWPGRLVHGFDADKRYIDDQGRNKSVFQDPNYVPMDLYTGNRKSEDLSAIGDYMGIAKDAPNHDEIVKDQMRKTANQMHTLWMLTSGGAVPILTALLSSFAERFYEPYLIAHQSKKAEQLLDALHGAVIEGKDVDKAVKPYKVVSSNIKKFVELGEGQAYKIVTQAEVDALVNTITKDAGHGVSGALAKDINAMFDVRRVVVDEKFCQDLAKNIEIKFQSHPLLKNGIVSLEEIKAIVEGSSGANISEGVVVDDVAELLNKIVQKGQQNISAKVPGGNASRVQAMFENAMLAEGSNVMPRSTKLILTDSVATQISKLAKPLEDYISIFKQVKDANVAKMGDLLDSQNTFFWNKLEKAYTNLVCPNASLKDLNRLMDNPQALEKVMISNLEKLASDEKAFEQALKSINEIKISYLREMLGKGNEGNVIDLIIGKSGSEHSVWQKRTFATGGTKVDKFIELQNTIATRLQTSLKEGHLDSTFKNLVEKVIGKDATFSTSVASHEIRGQVGKIEDFVTACDRMLHSLDVYRRAHLYNPELGNNLGGSANYITKEWVPRLFEMAKKQTIAATSTDVFAQFGTNKLARVFQSYMALIYGVADSGVNGDSVFGKGYITEFTEKTLEGTSSETLKHWINKFRNLVGDDPANWQYAGSKAGNSGQYGKLLTTPEMRYHAQGKNLVELAGQGVKKAHNSGKWFRMFGGLFVGIWGLSVAAQFLFGHKDDTIPLEKDRLKAEKQAERMAK